MSRVWLAYGAATRKITRKNEVTNSPPTACCGDPGCTKLMRALLDASVVSLRVDPNRLSMCNEAGQRHHHGSELACHLQRNAGSVRPRSEREGRAKDSGAARWGEGCGQGQAVRGVPRPVHSTSIGSCMLQPPPTGSGPDLFEGGKGSW
eukprot:2177452-Rhodomonas_salina.2